MTLPPPLPDHSRGFTIVQLIVSILGIFLSILGLGVLVIISITSLISPENATLQMEGVYSLGWILGMVLLLTIPSLVLSIKQLRRIPPRRANRKTFLAANLSLILIPLLFLLGTQIYKHQSSAYWMTPINILLVMIPIAWFVEIGCHQLNRGSAQRLWGLSSLSIYLTLPLVLFIEIAALFFGSIAGSFWLIQQPEAVPLFQQIQHLMWTDPLAIQNLNFDYLPLLQKPEMIVAIIAGVCLLTPLIEELLKPLGVWLLAGKNLTPVEGFAAGLVCGASFALLESVFSLIAVPGNTWMILAAGRAGTGLLHIITTGLNGWALASSWKDGRFVRIGLTYVLTVIFHGIWNFVALLMGAAQVGPLLSLPIDPVYYQISIGVIAVLVLIMIIVLIAMNRKLKKQAAEATPPPLPQTISY